MRYLIGLFLLLCATSYAQVDFNNYTTLLSAGEVPEDFNSRTYEKLDRSVAKNETAIEKKYQFEFYKGIHYTIDDILHSGQVCYGDAISNYVEEIADRLLENDPELQSQLRFYTIKSNAANAFSTEQGIVFVTTGLVAQVTSEAQLAFILAHEICHSKARHVIKAFNYRKNNRDKTLTQMSVFSKDREFEADAEGLKMYHAAGYSLDEVIPTFDVLMYSYLPFDEKTVTLNYFIHSDSVYLPEDLISGEEFEISADEDEDDSYSSHPNIGKRKEAVEELLEGLESESNIVYPLGEERFMLMRNIARFEYLRNNVKDADFGEAIYTIYLLEQEFKHSMYLERMKAQSWLGLLSYTINNRVYRTTKDESEYEGASAAVHKMINELSHEELETLCIRQLKDLYSNYEEDEEISLIWNKAIESLAYDRDFNSDIYKEVYYPIGDTTKPEADSLDYYLYLIPDVITSNEFLEKYAAYSDKVSIMDSINEAHENLPGKEWLRQNAIDLENEGKMGIGNILALEPTVKSYRKRRLDKVLSDRQSYQFADIMKNQSSIDFKVQLISKVDSSNQTEDFNHRNILFNLVRQVSLNENIDPFPVDFQLLKKIKEERASSNIIMSVIEHYKPFWILNRTEVSVLVVQLDPVEMTYRNAKFYKRKPKEKTIQNAYAYFFDLFQKTAG